MLRLSKEMRATDNLDCVTALCREGWVVTRRPVNIPGAIWTLRRLVGDVETDDAARQCLLSEAAESDYMGLSTPRDIFRREVAEALSLDGDVCVFEHTRADGEAVGWRMCHVWGEDFLM